MRANGGKPDQKTRNGRGSKMVATESVKTWPTTQDKSGRGNKQMRYGILSREIFPRNARPLDTCTMIRAGAWLGGALVALGRSFTAPRAAQGIGS